MKILAKTCWGGNRLFPPDGDLRYESHDVAPLRRPGHRRENVKFMTASCDLIWIFGDPFQPRQPSKTVNDKKQ